MNKDSWNDRERIYLGFLLDGGNKSVFPASDFQSTCCYSRLLNIPRPKFLTPRPWPGIPFIPRPGRPMIVRGMVMCFHYEFPICVGLRDGECMVSIVVILTIGVFGVVCILVEARVFRFTEWGGRDKEAPSPGHSILASLQLSEALQLWFFLFYFIWRMWIDWWETGVNECMIVCWWMISHGRGKQCVHNSQSTYFTSFLHRLISMTNFDNKHYP